MTAETIAARIASAREIAGLSQRELAEKSGVGEKTISSFETARRASAIKIAQLLKIADACDVPIGFFFVSEPPQSVPSYVLCECGHASRPNHVRGSGVCLHTDSLGEFDCECEEYRAKGAA